MFALQPHRQFGQWEVVLDIAKIAIPTLSSFATTWYQTGVAKDIAETQAEATAQAAELQASVKRYEIEKLFGLQEMQLAAQQQGGVTGTVAGTLSTQVAGFPMWAIVLIAGMGVFMLSKKGK
jgi:hypothetical protein